MGKIQKPVPEPPVKVCSANDLYRAKKARRVRLAALPVDEKIDLIEKLRDAGKDLIRARETLVITSAEKGRTNSLR